jgi:thiamine kinase-like enzyme
MSLLIEDGRIAAICSQFPILRNAVSVKPLGGGLTNKNYRIDTKEATYVLRVSEPSSTLLAIDRNNERINTARAHMSGVGPRVIDCLPEENVLLIEWIEANTLHAADLRNSEELLVRIAGALKKLHSATAFDGEFYFPDVRKNYKATVVSNDYFMPDEYLELEPRILDLENALGRHSEEKVACNNDLLAENFLDDVNKFWIIDYEYAGQNEPSFDIGNLAAESELNDFELARLCDAYWQEHSPLKIAKAIAWSMIARYGWVLWASIQERISSIDFDFRKFGMSKWDSVLPDLKGDRYNQTLYTLTNL